MAWSLLLPCGPHNVLKPVRFRCTKKRLPGQASNEANGLSRRYSEEVVAGGLEPPTKGL